MARIRSKKDVVGVVGVVVAVAIGATLPLVLSATAGARGARAATPAVASCSPPGISDSSAAVADFSPPCIPALAAVPDTGLADGQSVNVTGSGFSANTEVAMVECQPGAVSEEGCDLNTVVIVNSDGSGDFTTPYNVTRIINVGDEGPTTTQIDCAKAACVLGAADIEDFSVSAFTPLSFDPTLPLQLSGTVNKKGSVQPRKGVATISGTLTCLTSTTVDVDVYLVQFFHRFVFSNEVDNVFPCSPTTSTWSIAVPPGNGLYGVGKSQATVDFDAQIGNSFRDIEVNAKVHLSKGGKSTKK
jgi:hypothetical protein